MFKDIIHENFTEVKTKQNTTKLESVQQMGILCPRKHLSRMVKIKPYSNKITVFQRLRTALLVMLLKKKKSSQLKGEKKRS